MRELPDMGSSAQPGDIRSSLGNARKAELGRIDVLDAKAIAGWPGKKIDGEDHPALWHMLDVGAVADRLIEKRPVTESASWDQAIVLMIVLHDLGKFSECFRGEITGAAARAEYHSQLSFVLLQRHDSLPEEHVGGSAHARRSLCAAVAGHHGGPPELDDGRGILERRWMSAIGERAVEAAAEAIASVGTLFPEASLEGLSAGDAKALSWKVSGLTVQADWIGSNADWFGCQLPDIPVAKYWADARSRAKHTVTEAGLHLAKPRPEAVTLPKEATRPRTSPRRDAVPDDVA